MTWRGVVAAAVLAVSICLASLADGARAGGGPLTDDELRRAADAARRSTVLVSGQGCDGVQVGSAFGLSGHLVTSRHLVEAATSASVATPTGLWEAAVMARHPELDLAVVAGVGGPDLELAATRPDVGEPVVLAGRPGGGHVEVAASRVQLYADGPTWGLGGEVLLVDTPTGGGWSGGPVLDRDGRVVAVLAAEDRATGLALAVPVTGLGPWLTAGGRGGPPPRPCERGAGPAPRPPG